MIATSNLSIQFGANPLFDNVSVPFGDGNRYGLIGANGSGKSTLMKILSRELEPTSGNVSTDPNTRVGVLRHDQFAYESHRVLDTVIMGHERLWDLLQERERLYSQPELNDEDGMRVAEIEVEFAELVGNSAEANAIEALNLALDNNPGTLIFISHDREFVGSLATRIIELTPDGIMDYAGSYEEYLRAQIKRPNRKVA